MRKFKYLLLASLLLIVGCGEKAPPRPVSYEERVGDLKGITGYHNRPEVLEKTRTADANYWETYKSTATIGDEAYDRAQKAVKVGTAEAELLDKHFEEYRALRERAEAEGWLNSYQYQERVEALCFIISNRVQVDGEEAALQSAPEPD